MSILRKALLTLLLLAATCLSAASAQSCRAFTARSVYHGAPSFVDLPQWHDTLSVSTSRGTYHCLTQDAARANAFVSAQETLLHFLEAHGLEVQPLTYYAADDGDCFSISERGEAHIALSRVQSSQQVRVTLQALWGDYTSYGYLFALSNRIAAALGWAQDAPEAVDSAALRQFFCDHPAALCLEYPFFSPEYASAPTIRACQTLSLQLLGDPSLSALLSLPVSEQLTAHRQRLREYAQAHSLPLTEPTCQFAYGSAELPLRIRTTYAEMVFERGYTDYYAEHYSGCYGDAAQLLHTAETINREISAAIARFSLEEKAGVIQINWLSPDSARARFDSTLVNHYGRSTKTVWVTTLQGYLHEYHHHIEALLSPGHGQHWQSQAFCELGRAHSIYAQQPMWNTFMHHERWADLFTRCTGRACQPALEDYYECYDILCFITGETTLDYRTGRNAINSFCHYLIGQYGEATAFALMLRPEDVQRLTGQDWPTLTAAWQQHLQSKYAVSPTDIMKP